MVITCRKNNTEAIFNSKSEFNLFAFNELLKRKQIELLTLTDLTSIYPYITIEFLIRKKELLVTLDDLYSENQDIPLFRFKDEDIFFKRSEMNSNILFNRFNQLLDDYEVKVFH
jgi:hypothetical protein